MCVAVENVRKPLHRLGLRSQLDAPPVREFQHKLFGVLRTEIAVLISLIEGKPYAKNSVFGFIPEVCPWVRLSRKIKL